ncbi:MAG: metallophosphoesterase family protein [Chloroflexi bacterium]|nr:metallophosphoesterase family protein [Chloroflexota bacterium]
MKIGVLADTHIPTILPALPPRILELFNGIDIILHVGDVCDLTVLQQLEPIAQTFAVSGDQDSPEVKKYLQEKQRLEFSERAVGLVHGHRALTDGGFVRRMVYRFNREKQRQDLYAGVLREFDNVDAIIFGHTHEPYIKMHGGVLLFNPGSVARPTNANSRGTVGILEITPFAIKGRIVPL